MKKLNRYLKNKRLSSVSLLLTFTIIFIVFSTLNYTGTPTHLFIGKPGHENLFLFGGYILDPQIPNEFLYLILSFFISFTSFKLLHNKKLGLTTLAFPQTRSQLFTKKTVLPLTLVILSGVAAKTILFFFNLDAFGFSKNLLGFFLLNILIFIQYILLGFTLGIFGRLLTARTSEGLLISTSILFLPKTIYLLINILSSEFLHGYCDFFDGTNPSKQFFDPISYFLTNSTSFARIPVESTPHSVYFSHSVLWIVVSITLLFVSKKIFIKTTKYEKIGINNKYPLCTIIISTVIPLIAFSLFYYREYNSFSKKEFIPFFLVAVVTGIIINIFITKELSISKSKVFTFSAIIGTPLIISLLLISGGLGYETRIPNTEKIEKIVIYPSLPLVEKATALEKPFDASSDLFSFSNSYYNKSEEFFIVSSRKYYKSFYYTLEFTDTDDFERIFKLHESAIKNRNSETSEAFKIEYTYKNGTVLSREYFYIDTESVEKLFGLWESNKVKSDYKNWLLQSNELTDNKTYSDFNYIFNEIVFSKGATVTLQSKDSVANPLNLSDADFLRLKTAIYNDIYSMTWEEWFKPQKTYGNLTFTDDYSIRQQYYYNDYTTEPHTFTLTLPITSDMINTVKFLEGIDALKKFEGSRFVNKAYIINTEECANLHLSQSELFEYLEIKSHIYHSVLFNNIKQEFPIATKSYGRPFSSDKYLSIAKEVSPEELKGLIERAHNRYYCGADSDLLLVWTDDLTNEIYVLPN